MNEQVLEQVAKMLRAQLKGAGHLWWIGGFVYGITGNNDPFIILYPADEKLHEKVVRVYPARLRAAGVHPNGRGRRRHGGQSKQGAGQEEEDLP